MVIVVFLSGAAVWGWVRVCLVKSVRKSDQPPASQAAQSVPVELNLSPGLEWINSVFGPLHPPCLTQHSSVHTNAHDGNSLFISEQKDGWWVST